jgi:hypothetical protein
MSRRTKTTMETENKKNLQISYEDFLAVLKEWDKYTFVLLKKLADEMPTTFEQNSDSLSHLAYVPEPSANKIKLSELSELLWKSLEIGANEVDHIHDGTYKNEQATYFRAMFDSPESAYWNFIFQKLQPMEEFLKLGKYAQTEIFESGFLNIAQKNCEKSKIVAQEKIEQERIENQKQSIERELKRAEEERKRKEKVLEKLLKKELRHQAKELDNNKCVFCGNSADNEGFKLSGDLCIENFVSACTACITKKPFIFYKNEKKDLLKFGRFENKD